MAYWQNHITAFAVLLPLPFLTGWLCCCSSPSPCESRKVTLHGVLCMRVTWCMVSPQPSLLGCLQPRKELALAFLPALPKPSGPGALSLKLTPSFSLSSARGQGLQLCFSLSFSGWLLANVNKGVTVAGLEVALISASAACFHLPVLHLFLALVIACFLPDSFSVLSA